MRFLNMKGLWWQSVAGLVAGALAAKLLGIIGVVIVVLLMAGLWRRRNAQIITAIALIVVCLSGIALQAAYRATPTATTIAATTTSGFAVPDGRKTATASPQPTVAPATDWNRAATAFEATHPDLKIGQNIEIMQSKINEITNPTLTNEVVLQEAYELAVRAPYWTTVASPLDMSQASPYAALPAGFVLDSQPPPPNTNPGEQSHAPAVPIAPTYLQTVMNDASACRQGGGDMASCYVKASPKRCTQQALSLIAHDRADALKTWAICVKSCEAASAVSKLIGDCRRG